MIKKQDIIFFFVFAAAVIPFLPLPWFRGFHESWLYNESYWVYTSFLKFTLLATMGEIIGLRIKEGIYYKPSFGLLPRMIVWGFLGLTVKVAFVTFAAGVPVLASKYFGVTEAINAMSYRDVFEASEHGLAAERVFTAFLISSVMNFYYAPVLMVFHKITDFHILNNGGTLKGFFRPVDFVKNFGLINWKGQWGFIFKKTIPLFWIPMQTITFSVASEYRVAIAAFLGIVLGVILSFADGKK